MVLKVVSKVLPTVLSNAKHERALEGVNNSFSQLTGIPRALLFAEITYHWQWRVSCGGECPDHFQSVLRGACQLLCVLFS